MVEQNAGAEIRSMTGFGSARAEQNGVQIEAEVRSLNHRHLKLQVRLPDLLSAFNARLEELVRTRLARGSVYLQVRLSSAQEGSSHTVDVALLKRFHKQLSEVAQELGLPAPGLGEAALLPGVVRAVELGEDQQDSLWPEIARVSNSALDQLEGMRRTEGAGIARDLLSTTSEIVEAADQVELRAPQAVKEQAARLRGRISQLLEDSQLQLGTVDLVREVALLADKSDISEELQRVRSHVEQMQSSLLTARGPVGRKLEFLAQELLREANTMASKSNDTSLTQRVLGIKLQVERIREQVANIE